MDRRSFVKAAVGVTAAAAAGATATALTVPLAKPRPPAADPVPYYGFHKIGGPAPRGVPLIPIFVNADGAFEGKPVVADVPPAASVKPTNEGGVNVLDWYKFCGHGGAPGLRTDWDGDSVLRYFVAEDKIALGFNPWFADRLGDPIRPEHFTEPGLGASFVWRSEGQSGANVLTGVIMRWDPASYTFAPSKVFPPAKAVKGDAEIAWVRQAFMVEDAFIASSTFCPHFCCIPGYKEAERLAASRDAADKLFCTCHFSIYNPREVVGYTFSPESEGGDGEAAGGAH